MKKKILEASAIIAIFTVMSVMLLYSSSIFSYIEKSYIYPIHYQEIIADNSKKHSVEESLIFAVIRNESGFKEGAVSTSGAVGLMQIMPETAAWIDGERLEEFSEKKLYDAEHNIAYGVWYLAFLRREFGGNDVLALAAYNAGIANVHEWIEKYNWSYNFCSLEAIPYPETRHYVDKVLADKARYKKLYDGIN